MGHKPVINRACVYKEGEHNTIWENVCSRSDGKCPERCVKLLGSVTQSAPLICLKTY